MHEVANAGSAGELLQRAARGDARAWREVVDVHRPLVWSVARAYGLSRSDAEDVEQVTWLLLAENVRRLREPAALTGWLVTTARREAIRLGKARRRESPTGIDGAATDVPDAVNGPEQQVLRSWTASRVGHAFAELSGRCQQLLRIVACAPEMSYAQVGEALGMARGTVGPKRARCLAQLRTHLLAHGVTGEAAG
ncbi:sigma-70 family RNA polymerase sigma factor [Allosaccharopolyspora coralli]|uniref:Sigma-70 family RNA polymerase sigma factor n=1 Tax=Allosaccharopolyspora coralli TaxID=2665642 RepID=A0A5Q3QE98_9PSEU|nr:sigma-70 family RNA polymerase sigma factor [Allosaccharopolyspora coralli]QGK71696.1 sigma-70 family RNA polymerase sigma factor [Allosaccharopolyspora coralli]